MIIFPALFGLVIGSFLNVLIYRMPREESIVFPGSHCTACGHELKWYELIPLFSYLFLRGKCHSCKVKISPIYPFVEVLNSLFYVLVFLKFGYSLDSIIYSLVTSALIAIAFIDFKNQIIPDELNVFILILGIIKLAYSFSLSNLLASTIGLLAGGGFFLLLAVVTGGAMGGGDIKLMGALGFLLGWKQIILVSFFSFILGALISVALIATKIRKMKDYIPFGPFIVLSGIIAIFFGASLISYYLNSFQ